MTTDRSTIELGTVRFREEDDGKTSKKFYLNEGVKILVGKKGTWDNTAKTFREWEEVNLEDYYKGAYLNLGIDALDYKLDKGYVTKESYEKQKKFLDGFKYFFNVVLSRKKS